jgi:pyrophosphate--fructose-6-phosphate 1-phosphotransferase
MTLSEITTEMADMICMRSKKGKEFGIVLVPEGLIEFIPEVKVLITSINDLLAEMTSEIEGCNVSEIKEKIIGKLEPEPCKLFKFLPKAISE